MLASIFRKKAYLLLILVVIFAGILRFYNISKVPVSLYWDEVSSAYNAYSILKTGNDEFGNSHPLLFRAFEDYKTPANIYLTAIPVAIFGLNEFSARFTSAFLGTLTVLMVFFLTKELVPKKFNGINNDYIALLASVFLAISPWHLQFSRTGFEANVGLFFVVTAAVLFFRSIRLQKPSNLYISAIFFAVSIYFYRSIWVFAPLLIISLVLIHRKTLFDKLNLKKTLVAGLIFAAFLLPFIPKMISPEGQVRIRQVNVVDNSTEQTSNFVKQQANKGEIGKAIYNRRIAYGLEVVQGYLAHFSPNFLFLTGDGNLRHGAIGYGVMYLTDAIFLLFGLISLRNLDKRIAISLIAWILIAPIPASVSVPTPHALRSLNEIPIPQIVSALGAIFIFAKLKNIKWQASFGLIAFLLILLQFAGYLNSYYGNTERLSSSNWADGYKQLAQYTSTQENKYDKIVVSGHWWQPYIYFLFYKNYDPGAFQIEGSKRGFDKYIFGGTSWDMNGKELGDRNLSEMAGTKKILVALSPVEYSLQKDNINVATEIRNHNNELVFIVGTLK